VRRLLGRFITLLALIALGSALRALSGPGEPGAVAAMLLGFTVLTSYVAGDVAAAIGLPRLTGYVLAGILVGPSVLGVLSPASVEDLRTVDHIALALIALTAGGELRLGELRGRLRSITAVALGVVLVVLAGMTALVLLARPLVPGLAGEPVTVALGAAVMLGIWSANSSPDATIAVINEVRAEGPLTETVLGVTILKDVIVIMAFGAALSLVKPLVEPGAAFRPGMVGTVAWDVLGGIGVGLLAGLLFSVYLGRAGTRTVLGTLAFAFLLTLLADAIHVELLLAAVAAGFAIENFSPAGDALIRGVEANALVVFALFFALAGAMLDMGSLWRFGPLAAVVVAARAGLTWAGARLGARVGGTAPAVGRAVWLGLVSQAGVTLGLSLIIGRELPGLGQTFVNVTGAVIVVHLLLGPVLLKLALQRAGETGPAAAPAR
jgi:Kef-type K+ transport system membrane component KefB